MHISYLEIYNETGYDLLNPDREVQMLEDLPKVAIMEDEESNIHMRNLSIHRANNEEEALNLVGVDGWHNGCMYLVAYVNCA